MARIDTSKYTTKQLEDFKKLLAMQGMSIEALNAAKQAEPSKLGDKTYRDKVRHVRPEFEKLAEKHGVALSHVATELPKAWRDPTSGLTFAGRGAKPKWLEGHEEDPTWIVP